MPFSPIFSIAFFAVAFCSPSNVDVVQAAMHVPPLYTADFYNFPTSCSLPASKPEPGEPCKVLGQQVCLSGGAFITCAAGNKWSVVQACGKGTVCQAYPTNSCYVLCGYGTPVEVPPSEPKCSPTKPQVGKSCQRLGQQVCVGNGFSTCSSGNIWSAVQKCGKNTKCSPYPGDDCYAICGH